MTGGGGGSGGVGHRLGRLPSVALRGAHRGAFAVTLAGALAGASGTALALDPAKAPSEFAHAVWTTQTGLPQSSVPVICQTRDGYVWAGTLDGLVRLDGLDVTVFSRRTTPALGDNQIYTLTETKDGALWIGTAEGLTRYAAGRFERWPLGDAHAAAVYSVAEARDGALWVGTGAGLVRLTGGAATLHGAEAGLPERRVLRVFEDRRRTLWVASGASVGAFSNGRFQGDALRLAVAEPTRPVFLELPDGTLLLGNARGLHRLSGERFQPYRVVDQIVQALVRDRDGNVWIGTAGGVFRLSEDGRLVGIDGDDVLAGRAVLSLAEDREGGIWIGTRTRGLSRLSDAPIATLTRRHGLPEDVLFTVHADAGGIWVGTALGHVARLAPGASTFTPVAKFSSTVRALARDEDGTLFVGTFADGLARLSGSRLVRFSAKDGFPAERVSALLVDRRGGLFVGTSDRGLFRLEDGRFTVLGARDGLPGDSIRSLFQDARGDVWVGVGDQGVAVLTGVPPRVARVYTTREGLGHGLVHGFHEDADGTLWLATQRGLSRFRDGRFVTCRETDGLVDENLVSVAADADGHLWLGSDHGLQRVAKADLASFAEGRLAAVPVASYGLADGMKSVECAAGQPGVAETADGRLLFATQGGLVVFEPGRLEDAPPPPAAIVEKVVHAGRSWPLAPSVTFPPGDGRFEVHYAAPGFRDPRKIRFRYRLAGLERGWVEAGERRVAFYTNVPPGKYDFHVTAANASGAWRADAAVFAITLESPFYRTGWFLFLAASVGVLLASELYRARVKTVRARERLRTELVEARLYALQSQLRPHFLFNALNALLTLVEKDAARAQRMVVGLSDLLRISLKSDLRPFVTIEEELSALASYVEIERVRFGDRLSFDVRVDADLPPVRVPALLLQPLVENAVKHGLGARTGPLHVEVRARVLGERLFLTVTDDGPGLAAASSASSASSAPHLPEHGVGVANIRRRLATIYGERHRFTLADRPQGGCRAEIEIPFEPPGALRENRKEPT